MEPGGTAAVVTAAHSVLSDDGSTNQQRPVLHAPTHQGTGALLAWALAVLLP
jgi:hypothetical protein